MHIKQSATLFGHLEVSVFDASKGGKRVYHVKKRNQIVNQGRQAVLEMLVQDPAGSPGQQNPEYNQLWALGVGSDGTPPTVHQTGLVAPVLLKVLPTAGSILYVPDPVFEIHCTMTFDLLEALGPLEEVALYTRGNNANPYAPPAHRLMYARQTFSPFTKTNVMTVEFNWILGMSVA